MLLSNLVRCNSKEWKFLKEQEAKRLLSTLGKRKSLSQTPLVGPLLI